MAHPIFICFHPANQNEATEVCDFLEGNGFPCWMPGRDCSATNRSQDVPNAIVDCEYVVYIASDTAEKADFIQAELNLAKAKKKIFLPFELDEFNFYERAHSVPGEVQRFKASKDFKTAIGELLIHLNGENAYQRGRIFFNKARKSKVNNNPNFTYALTCFKQAASIGHAGAQAMIGVLYSNGEGVPKDEKTSIDWYTKAAENGDPSAQYVLGIYYQNKGDYKKAIEWFSKSGENGNLLSVYYEEELIHITATYIP